MKALIQTLKIYLKETLGLQLEFKPWNDKKNLPIFFNEFYFFYTSKLLGKQCLIIVDRDSDTLTPAAVRKHVEHLRAATGFPCIYVIRVSTSYQRKRLMAQGVQFVIPKQQIYLPHLGIDWQETSRLGQPLPSVQKLSPSAQAVVILALIQEKGEFIPLELAKTLHYTTMSMTRALNELEALGLGKSIRKGKERWFYLIEKLWEKAEPYMQNPVKKRLWVSLGKKSMQTIKRQGVIAGLSALAEQTMLSHPSLPIYALTLQSWKEIVGSDKVLILPIAEGADIELEVWNYDPKLFAIEGHVDSFSLYLSLKEIQDERVEMALQELMEGANGQRIGKIQKAF